MTFWSAQLGPYYEGDPRTALPDRRCIGELLCPECENILARLFDETAGIALSGWIPARNAAVADPTGRRVGWSLHALIDDEMPDEEGAAVECWRGHLDLAVTARDCRAAAGVYRATGRKKRFVATRACPGEPR